MENLLLLFENISSVNRALIIVSGITFFWVIEGIIPFKFLNYNKLKHSFPNFLLTLELRLSSSYKNILEGYKNDPKKTKSQNQAMQFLKQKLDS